MTEYVNQILAHTDLFVSGVVGLCVVGGILIEYSPIPLNPVRWLGNRLNQDLKKDINNVRKDVSDLDKRLDKIEESGLQRDLQSKRSIVLDFAYKLRKTDDEEISKVYTLEDFENVIDVIDEYHELIIQHGIPNGKFDIARDYIIDTFTRLSKEGKFVKK